MRARIRSTNQAGRNIQDGISLVRTADGALMEYQNLLGRARELVVAAGNGTLSAEDLNVLEVEYGQIADELLRISQETEFNDIELLAATQTIELQAGPAEGDTIAVETRSITIYGLAMGIVNQGFGLDTTYGRATAELLVDFTSEVVTELRGELGAAENRLQSAYRSLTSAAESLTAAESRIRDVDLAYETSALARQEILQQAGLAALVQANLQPYLALKLLGWGETDDQGPASPPLGRAA